MAMYNLIIIDDEYEIRVGLANYFPWNEIDFMVTANFDSPLKALDFIRSNPVDAALCDIKMPRMTGLEFAKKLYEENSGVKIVLLSGYKEFDFLKEAMEYKIFDYLLKPVTHVNIKKTFTALHAELDKRKSLPRDSEKFPGEIEGLISVIKTYMEKNYSTTSLEDTAAYIHMNPNYLSRFFKQKTGENYSDYLIRLKMKKALDLMNNHGLKTYHISEMVGYNNPNNFTRAFKKLFGKAPKDYRNNGI
jgi:YesN/AraC family two-component response regulator